MTYPVQLPLFPPEVERFIFEYAADCSLDDAIIFLTVAKRVLGWVEPTIFRVLAFHEEYHWPPIKRFVNGTVLETFKKHGKHVQSLLIGESFPDDETVTTYLSYCPNLVDLGLWERERLSRELVEKIAEMKLKRLSMNLRWISDDVHWEGTRGVEGKGRDDASCTGSGRKDLTRKPRKRAEEHLRRREKICIAAWRHSLTHLELLDEIDSWMDWRCVFRGLERLTHVSLPGACEGDEDVIEGVLRECRRLEVLVLAEPFSDDDSSSSGDEGQEGEDNEGERHSVKGEVDGAPEGEKDDKKPREDAKDSPKIAVGESKSRTNNNPVEEAVPPKLRKSSYDGGDPRVVALDCQFFVEWLRRAVGKRDIWAFAEDVVRERLEERGDSSKSDVAGDVEEGGRS